MRRASKPAAHGVDEAVLLGRELEGVVVVGIDAAQLGRRRARVEVHERAVRALHRQERVAARAVLEVLADADGFAIGPAADAARRRLHLERGHELVVVEDRHHSRPYERMRWL